MPVADSAAMQVSTPIRRFVRRRRASVPSFMKDRAAREEALRGQLQKRLSAARERSDEVLGLVRDEALLRACGSGAPSADLLPRPSRGLRCESTAAGQPRARSHAARTRSALRLRHRPPGQWPAGGRTPRLARASKRSADTVRACVGDRWTAPSRRHRCCGPSTRTCRPGGRSARDRAPPDARGDARLSAPPAALRVEGARPAAARCPSRHRAGAPARRDSRGPHDARARARERTPPRLGQRVRSHEVDGGRVRDRATTSRTRDFLAFVAAGGYRRASLWSEDGLGVANQRAAASTRPSGCARGRAGGTARCSARCRCGAVLAGVREPGRGRRVRALARALAADRGAVPARGVRHPRGRRARPSVGRRGACGARTASSTSGAGTRCRSAPIPRATARSASPTWWATAGNGPDALRALPRLPAASVLPRLLGRLLRRPPLRR